MENCLDTLSNKQLKVKVSHIWDNEHLTTKIIIICWPCCKNGLLKKEECQIFHKPAIAQFLVLANFASFLGTC